MAERDAHLVGSLPGETPAEAMRTALEILGPRLRSLPDGETGERRNWVISIIESLRDHRDLQLKKTGDWSDYDKIPVLQVRRGHTLYGANLDFGHVAAVSESYPAFREVTAAAGRPDLVFQEGVPGDFDLAMFTLGPAGALRQRRAFTEATLTEIRQVGAITGAGHPVPDRGTGRARAARQGAAAGTSGAGEGPGAAHDRPGRRLGAGHALRGAPVPGRHEQQGLRHDERRQSARAAVQRHRRGLAADRPLDLIHAPFAAADHPATTDPSFYEPLQTLVVPVGTRFAAGFAHESQSLDDQRTIRGVIEGHLGGEVAIAAACGLGRRTPEDGRAVLERMAELCTS